MTVVASLKSCSVFNASISAAMRVDYPFKPYPESMRIMNGDSIFFLLQDGVSLPLFFFSLLNFSKSFSLLLSWHRKEPLRVKKWLIRGWSQLLHLLLVRVLYLSLTRISWINFNWVRLRTNTTIWCFDLAMTIQSWNYCCDFLLLFCWRW